jgi:uncharacterized protein (TIGR02117 family)
MLLKTAGYFFSRLLLVLLLSVIMYLFTALAFYLHFKLTADKQATNGHDINIYLVADNFHADIVIPVDADNQQWDFLFKSTRFPVARNQIRLLSFGWGSREFYLKMRHWSQFDISLGLKAITFDHTVMHVTAYQAAQLDSNHPLVTNFKINQQGYEKLVNYIKSSYKLNQQAAIAIPGQGYHFNDMFFEAHGLYNPVMTCNQWTAEALNEAGIKTPLWVPFTFMLK